MENYYIARARHRTDPGRVCFSLERRGGVSDCGHSTPRATGQPAVRLQSACRHPACSGDEHRQQHALRSHKKAVTRGRVPSKHIHIEALQKPDGTQFLLVGSDVQ